MSFAKDYELKRKQVDIIIDDFISQLDSIPEPLLSSIKYSLSAGGKRLRPVIFLEALNIFGGEITESAKKFMCAIECIHTYSLIHDDLPCMDNDDFRRGKPTNHKVYGEDIAVLAGDALLNVGYELLFDALSICSQEENSRYIEAGKRLGTACGAKGLIAGQTLDLRKEGKPTASTLALIYERKTADLICAALVCGAIIGGANSEEIKLIEEYGYNFGFSFQLSDDIIDFENGEKDKNTFVNIYGVSKSKVAMNESVIKATEMLAFIGRDCSFLKILALKFAERKE